MRFIRIHKLTRDGCGSYFSFFVNNLVQPTFVLSSSYKLVYKYRGSVLGVTRVCRLLFVYI